MFVQKTFLEKNNLSYLANPLTNKVLFKSVAGFSISAATVLPNKDAVRNDVNKQMVALQKILTTGSTTNVHAFNCEDNLAVVQDNKMEFTVFEWFSPQTRSQLLQKEAALTP